MCRAVVSGGPHSVRAERTRKIWAFSKCVLYSNTNLRIDANLFDSGCGTMNWIISFRINSF